MFTSFPTSNAIIRATGFLCHRKTPGRASDPVPQLFKIGLHRGFSRGDLDAYLAQVLFGT